MSEYYLFYYINSRTKEKPAMIFLNSLSLEVQSKIFKYLEHLRVHNGYLDEPYARHIFGKIRELRVDFRKIRHRIFYFVCIGKRIILLNGFIKKTAKTPPNEVRRAILYYNDVLNNLQLYDQEQTIN